MANKYILVPEPNFNSLLAKEPQKEMVQTGTGIGDDLDEKSLFEFVKKQLSQAKKGKKKNASTKNVLFQQRLRSYLRARKALLNRPMKVQLESIGKEFLSKYGPKNLSNALLNEDGELEPIKHVPKVEKPTESVETFKTPTEGSATDVEQTTPTTSHTPIKSRRTERVKKGREKEEGVQERLSNIAKLIGKNPSKFGVGHDDDRNNWYIINPSTKKPVVNSNIMASISRIVNPTPENAPSPPGMIYLKRKLLEDPEASQLVNPSYKQSGKGWRKQKAKSSLKKPRFQPMKWKIQKRRR